MWSVGPGDPSKNLRHTCAGRSGSVTPSRWTVSSLAAGHAPPPNNAKLTALQSCMQAQACSLARHCSDTATYTALVYIWQIRGKHLGWAFFQLLWAVWRKFLVYVVMQVALHVWNVKGRPSIMISSTFLLPEEVIALPWLAWVVFSLSHPSSVHILRTCETNGTPCLKTLVPRRVQASWWPESNIPVQQRKCASLSRGRCRRKLQG